MENNINTSSAAAYCGMLPKSGDAQKKNVSKTQTFAEAVKEMTADAAAETAVCKDTEKLSAEEYKLYIYFKISRMQRQSPQKLQSKNFVLVNISDEGFAAMQSDPQYENWVLGKIKESLYYDNTWEKRDGTNYFILSFGENNEEYGEEFWFSGEFDDYPQNKSKQESYWDSRIKRQRKFDKIYFENLDKRRAFEKKLYEKTVAEKIARRKEENKKFLYKA